PKWLAAILRREAVQINGDGETSRDYCFIENVVQANLLAATTLNPAAINQAYNIAVGQRTTLNELFRLLQDKLRQQDPGIPLMQPVYAGFRAGDVRHSWADISKAERLLGFTPTHSVSDGLKLALEWYSKNALQLRS